MKRLFMPLFGLGCSAVMFCCSPAPAFRIEGTWEGGDGQTVWLQKELGEKSYLTLDSATVKDGKFIFTGPLVHDRRKVVVNGADRDIMLEATPIGITVGVETRGEGEKARQVTIIDVAQTPEQTVLKHGDTFATSLAFIDFGSLIAYSEVIDDPVKLDSVMKGVAMMKDEVWGQLHALLDTSRNIHASAFVIGKAVAKNQPLDSMIHYYDLLMPEVKGSYSGQWLAEEIELRKSVNVGGIAPDIRLPSPTGDSISLYSLRGKYVLIDFWASWCGPCLAEAPNVKAVYDRYRDKGFEVYGVSLDEKRDAWVNSIGKNDLDWVQVSSLAGWKCPAAKRYGVTGIPKTYLLDPDGRIIAVDLRGTRLSETIDSLLSGE